MGLHLGMPNWPPPTSISPSASRTSTDEGDERTSVASSREAKERPQNLPANNCKEKSTCDTANRGASSAATAATARRCSRTWPPPSSSTEQIVTTLPRPRTLARRGEYITLAKKGDLNSRRLPRLVCATTSSHTLRRSRPRYKDRAGGASRAQGWLRYGDSAPRRHRACRPRREREGRGSRAPRRPGGSGG